MASNEAASGSAGMVSGPGASGVMGSSRSSLS